MSVVKLEIENEIAHVIMEDRESKNCFSHEIGDGLVDAFEEIAKTDAVKVVILQGYEHIFSAGGSLDMLMEISAGNVTFDESKFFNLPLLCDIPVISAMQGHALGGGLVLGAYADIIVMGEECFYSTNFMKYGFTPGVGATFIIPYKFGHVLGTEMMLTAKNYRGVDLKARGAGPVVVPKAKVLEEAQSIAENLANKPNPSFLLVVT